MKLLLSLFSILCLVSFSSCCIHDQLNRTIIPYPHLPPSEENGRFLGVADRQNIRIHTTFYVGNAPTAVRTTIEQQLMPAVVAYYQAALKVNRLGYAVKLTDTDAQKCAEVNSNDAMKAGVEADLVLLITGLSEPDQGYVAYASACSQDSTGRPNIGMIHFNYAYGFDKDSHYTYQTQIYTTLHELGHVLGFSSALYPYFINPNTGQKLGINSVTKKKTVNGVEITMLTLPTLTSKLQTYFACDSLEGAYIEQQGGSGSAGSHFERRVFYNEFLTASDIVDCRISEFFLALLEGTGWYSVEYALAEPMFWGKGKGCAFLDTKCLNPSTKQTAFTDTFCSASSLGQDSCSFGAQAYGVCGTSGTPRKDTTLDSAYNYFGDYSVMRDSFADNCPYYAFYSGSECRDTSNAGINFPTGEYFGEESSCFTGTLGQQRALSKSSPMCLRKTCKLVSANQYNVVLQINGQTVTCTQEGTITVPGFQGVLNCPKPNDFCTTSGLQYCARGCLGRGSCVNNQCVCQDGYTGSDCSIRTLTEGETAPQSEPGSKAAAIGAGVGGGVGGSILLVVIAYIVKKFKEIQAAKAGADGGDAKAVGNPQNIQTSTYNQNQPGQDDPVQLNMNDM